MSGHTPPQTKLDQKTSESDQFMEYIKQQVQLLKEKAMLQASVREEKKLLVENAKLKKDIQDLKEVLQDKQKRKKARQATSAQNGQGCGFSMVQVGHTSSTPTATDKNPQRDEGRRRRAERKGERKEKRPDWTMDQEPKVDVSRLDLRVGRIVAARKHPEADSLYVEEVDLGEAVYRTVVSGLVKDPPLEELQDRMVVLLCNLRPSKMRGVLSQAMVMCAASQEGVEMLDPPSGAVPGDRVTFQSFHGEPDKELNPKQRVWEQVQADLRTDGKGIATYRGVAFEVRGKGLCRAQTMSHCGIK